MSRTLDVPATLEAVEQADLYAKVSGYVGQVNVDIGDRVKASQVLATLDIPEMSKDLDEAKAQQATKLAYLKAAETAGMKAAEAALDQAKRKLDVTRRELERKQSDLALSEITFKRKEILYKEKAVTDQELDETKSRLAVSQADVRIMEARVAAAEADVQGAEAAKVQAAAQVDIAKSQSDLAAAQVAKVQALLGYAQIVAPFDGVIIRRMVDRGALVQAATSSRTNLLFTIQRIDTIRIFLEAPEVDVPFISIKQSAKVSVYGLGGIAVDGTVQRTASSLNPATRTMRVEIDLPNPDGKLLHGMYAKVVLDIDKHANVLTLPAAALLTEGAEKFVYTVKDGRAVRTPVKTGLDDGIRIEIKEGIGDEDQVIVTGKGLVSDGVPVKASLKEK
ncbi:MAG: efflux RND transporter periplasmic adaptor subunit [Planctomycetes bacterium]|nr:efflux RND transporter periplasmic adaptor subunit [Planctomycetota bacterium]